jgi:hypothetical protein
VVDGAARAAYLPPGEPQHDDVVADHEVHHRVELLETLERLGLGDGAGEPVEDVPLRRVRPREALPDEAHGELVGYEVAPADDRFHLLPELRLALDRVAEDVARGDLGDAELLRHQAGEGALAGARGAEKDQVHAEPTPPWLG